MRPQVRSRAATLLQYFPSLYLTFPLCVDDFTEGGIRSKLNANSTLFEGEVCTNGHYVRKTPASLYVCFYDLIIGSSHWG